MVVAFGTQKKSSLTAAVATVDSKEIAGRSVANISQALQGVSPGLNITAANMGGALNNNPSIDIRGTGTIGEGSSSAPLVLIDGTPGDLNMINMQDVENISVLRMEVQQPSMVRVLPLVSSWSPQSQAKR